MFFLQSYVPRVWGHTWSLAVEEHFYLLLPILLILLIRLRLLTLLPTIAVALIVMCLILRVSTALRSDEMEAVLIPTHLRIDALFAGVTLGYVYHYRRQEFRMYSSWWVGALGVLLLLPSVLTNTTSPLLASIQFSYNLVGFSLIVLWAITRSFRLPWLGEIRRFSYSIYLWHLFVTAYWRQHEMNLFVVAGNLLTCVALGVTMGVLVELPMLQLRDVCFPSHRQTTNHLSTVSADMETRGSICAISRT
jgi:peptidoglycan/LPS O-acetylase OafA/YrhL